MANKPVQNQTVDPAATLRAAGIGALAMALAVWLALSAWGRVFSHASETVQLVTVIVVLGVVALGALLGVSEVERRVAK